MTTSWALAGFDLDGTLVHGDTVLQHVGRALGHGDLVRQLVCRYESFALDNTAVSNESAKLFAGLRRSDLYEIMDDISTIAGIREALARLRGAGVRCVVATVTFDFASTWFVNRYGFDAYNGIELEVDSDGRFTGLVKRHVNEWDKAKFIEGEADALGVPLSRVFYVGDSRSDLPTFKIVGYSVALNASPQARAAASASIETRSLLDVIDLVPGFGRDAQAGTS